MTPIGVLYVISHPLSPHPRWIRSCLNLSYYPHVVPVVYPPFVNFDYKYAFPAFYCGLQDEETHYKWQVAWHGNGWSPKGLHWSA